MTKKPNKPHKSKKPYDFKKHMASKKSERTPKVLGNRTTESSRHPAQKVSKISNILRPQAIVPLVILNIDEDAYATGENHFQAVAQMERGSKKPVGVIELPPHVAPPQKIMAKVIGKKDGVWICRFIRILEEQAQGMGVYVAESRTLEPIHRKGMFHSIPYDANPENPNQPKLADGDVVRFEHSARGITIRDNLGSIESSHVYSQIAAVNQDVWHPITPQENEACAHFSVPPLSSKRIDLRHIPLVTIDGADAKDFDDAVWAEPDTDERNPGGYRIVVAIADVAHYVKPGDILDEAAQKRGNSVYLPDYVIPMLPEGLSNDLCSLRPHCDRACMVVDMIISQNGLLKHAHFKRALMHSQARLTYEDVESMLKGKVNPAHSDVFASTIKPLQAAFKILRTARAKRGALDIHTTEHQLMFDDNHRVVNVTARANLTSHNLIEEMMVLANTAVAKALKNRDYPCMYRVHPTPDPVRVEGLRAFARSLNLRGPSSQKISPHDFNALLKATEKTPYASLFNDLILRCQAQARYSPENEGHFGLGLMDYAHFTSPITITPPAPPLT